MIITLFRCHKETAGLAIDWARGPSTGANADLYYEKLNREERIVAASVRGLSDTADTASPASAEAMRANSPRIRGAGGESDYLYIWGYKADIYYWSGLLPASRYLSAQPLTGVPADVHHKSRSRPILDESLTAAARARLVSDLEQTRPRYIVDELGYFNTELSIQSYPELREFLRGYKNTGEEGSFIIYRKREQHGKDRTTNSH